METENYYRKNQETGKLNIYTAKAFYDGLDLEKQLVFKRYCLWSGRQKCWVSKGKAENCGQLKAKLDLMGLVQKEAFGEKLSFEQQVERKQEKAKTRAERAEVLSTKAENNSNGLFQKAHEMASVIPFGQPILVGHHSEKRDRNYRGKIDRTFEKAFSESDKAGYYSDKAETARFTAEGKQFKSSKYLRNRIKQTESAIRQLERWLKGKTSASSQERAISEQAKTSYSCRLNEEKDKLQYYHKCMKLINPEWQPATANPKKNKRKSI